MFARQLVASTPRVLRGASQTKRLFQNHVRLFNDAAAAGKPKLNRTAWIVAGAAAIVIAGGATIASAQSVPAISEVEKKQRATFDKYASLEKAGQRYMTADDFLNAITTVESTNTHPRGSLDEDKFRVLFRMADSDKNNLITYEEYKGFQNIISKPDAEYMLAFTIFDRDANGLISKEDFKSVVETNFLDSNIPFDFNCELVRLYFGSGSNQLNYGQFTQLLKDLQQERIRQEFRFYDTAGTGYIPADKFADILSGVKLRKVPDHVKQNLSAVSGLNGGTPFAGQVSYAQFVACNDMLLHIPSYARVVRAACTKTGKKNISKDDFIREAHHSTSIEVTPMEVDIIYSLFDSDKDGRLGVADLSAAALSVIGKPAAAKQSKTSKTVLQATVEGIENFCLGAIAGAVGATAVYPIDLVKTRMQNQRAVDPSQRVYQNSWDCFNKVLKGEGARALYKGLGPQIIGVAPEKAIKLTVNDLLRGLFYDKSKGDIYFPLEVLAGGSAGASQVLFTNPLEIVKIRLQVQEAKGAGAVAIIRELGFFGLYKGAGACLLRDIPFSAIYFPTYAKMKSLLADDNGKVGAVELLVAGAVAGIPAASLVTPADVIKTRLQVKAKSGEQTYTGIRDCFWKILKAEGPTAFFKGCLMRVFRSSPQFGVTLLSYELLQQWLAPHITPRPPTNAPLTEQDASAFSFTVAKVDEMEKKFGTFGGNKKE